jgi:ATP-dependent helicase HrpB
VVVAPPGAGKTTAVPPALIEASWRRDSDRVVLLEPRRVAARAAAQRMSRLLGESGPGGLVGYRTRLDTRVSPRTCIEVVTEGVLGRMLQSDPSLPGVGVVIFDEFHERSIHADLGLALTLQARSLFRDDLRVLVMSATLAAEPVAELLGGAPVIRSEGREHPVHTRWRPRPVTERIEGAVARAVAASLEADEGDLLVFLPGVGEIRRTDRLLDAMSLPEGVRVSPLHGSLAREAQDRALEPAGGIRRVILATSIAETSLTIDGVRVVIDAGLMRVPRFDPGSGMGRLETVRVTRDAADQRRGRAGRQGPGVCYRLWTRGEDAGLVPRRTPEILSTDLAPLALDLARWGAAPDELAWLDPPPEAGMARARELLEMLELIDTAGALTSHGDEVARLGTHPRIGHMLVRARGWGLLEQGAELAALLSDRDLLRGPGRAPDADLHLRVEALRRGGRVLPRGHDLDRGARDRALRERDRTRRTVGRGAPSIRSDPPPFVRTASDAGITGILSALAFPDRIGRRRHAEPGGQGSPEGGGARGRFLLREGRGARVEHSPALEGGEWIVAVDVENRGPEVRIRRGARLEEDQLEGLFAEAFTEVDEVTWDRSSERVRARTVRRLGAIEVRAAPIADPDPVRVARALADVVRDGGLHLLPWTRELHQLRARLEFMHKNEADNWPSTSDEALLESLDAWLVPFLAGIRSLSGLAKLPLGEALLSRVPPAGRAHLEHWAPTHLEVPSGSRIQIDYSDPEAPVLAVRLQEVFGMTETPHVGAGRVPLTLHLLSPAHRPVQVTQDLASFWSRGYFEVRKDLRGRYPKHFWPEDPLTAPATRRTRPR